MASIVEEDIAFDPVHVGLFGPVGVVLATDGVRDCSSSFFGRWVIGFRLVDWYEEVLYTLPVGLHYLLPIDAFFP